MLAIISGPPSPSATQASHASARSRDIPDYEPLPRPLSKYDGLDQLVPAGAEPGKQAIGAFGCSVVRLTTPRTRKNCGSWLRCSSV